MLSKSLKNGSRRLLQQPKLFISNIPAFSAFALQLQRVRKFHSSSPQRQEQQPQKQFYKPSNPYQKSYLNENQKESTTQYNSDPATQQTATAEQVTAPVPVDPNTLGTTSAFIPQDKPSIIGAEQNDGLRVLLSQDGLVVTRAIEIGTLFFGFEQANKYDIRNLNGEIVGHIAEESGGIGKTILRNMTTTHRSFTAHIMDVNGNVVFRVRRPFFFINSHMYIEKPDGEVVGEIQQQWHLWRRKYNLFLNKKQYAHVDGELLAVSFNLQDEKGQMIAGVDKNFQGFMKEIFTDANQYVIRLGSEVQNNARPLTYDERAVTIAASIAIDFDYFSRHSGGPGWLGFLPIPIPMPMPSPAPTPAPSAEAPNTTADAATQATSSAAGSAAAGTGNSEELNGIEGEEITEDSFGEKITEEEDVDDMDEEGSGVSLGGLLKGLISDDD